MNIKHIWPLFLLAATTFSAESEKVPEHVTLETIREMVAKNEELINPIKLSYINKKSRKGERQIPMGGGTRSRGRLFSHSEYIWAQNGEKHFAKVQYFYGPNEPAGGSVYVINGKTTIMGGLPDLMRGEIHTLDSHDWYLVMVAKLGLRPFEGQYKLSEILVPEYASLHKKIEMLNECQTYVLDARRPSWPHYFARIWIDTQRGMPLRIWYYDKHPAWGNAKSTSQINDIELHQLPNGAWLPVKGLRTIHFSDYISYEHMSVDVNSISIQPKDIPDSLFEIDFPDGAGIFNVVTGFTTIKERPSKTYEQIIEADGCFIAGTAVDENGIPVSDVVVAPQFITTQETNGQSHTRSLQAHERHCAITDSKGRFAIELEQQGLYRLWFFPKNFMDKDIRDVPLGEKNLTVTLEKGGTVTGRVVRIEKGQKVPVPDIEVIAETERFVTLRMDRLKAVTDSQGRFQIKYLSTQLSRRSDNQYRARSWQIKCGPASENVIFEEGQNTREVELVLKPDPSMTAPLTGKKLPDFEGIKINLKPDQIQDRKMLLCFFDYQQRPARNCIMQLSKRAQELKEKDVAVVAVQASNIEKAKLSEWIKENNIPFPIGIIEGDSDEIKFNWSVQSLPWLILTDRQHIVQAEGFAISELDAKIKELSPSLKTTTDTNQVTGIVKNPEGQVLAGIKVTEYQTDKQYTTNKQGEFTSVYGPADERRVFFAVDKKNKLVGIGRLAAKGRNVEIKLVPARIVSGTVVDPDGKPVAGAQVVPLPMTCYHVLTDAQGKFDIGWSPQWAGDLKVFFLMARHLNRNLAGGIEIGTETENIQIELEPALTLTGTVEDPDSKPIAGAEVNISLIRRWGAGTPVREVITDKSGRFEIPTLLQKQEYGIRANAEGYWRNSIKTGIINNICDREDIGTIILKRPILSVTGVVVNGNGKPVANIPVYLWGDGQPDLDSKTDEQGKFKFEKVCSGPVQISAKNQSSFGIIDTQGGAENIRIIVSPRFEPDTNTP